MIKCIFCKTESIEKSIMAPRILSQEQKQNNQKSIKYIKKIQKDLLKMRNFVEKNFDYVGNNFPREVRNVYYDKRKNENIYGKATPEETQELEEEGIELTAIPWIDNIKN